MPVKEHLTPLIKYNHIDKLNKILNSNNISKEEFSKVSYECILLSIFVQLCNILEENENKKILRERLLSGTKTGERYIYLNFIKENLKLDLDQEEIEYLSILLNAFLNKSNKRIGISDSQRTKILNIQRNKCRYCGKNIDKTIDAHVDHIIPFNYVGDELGDSNLQILCEKCNKSKNASVIFLFKIFVERGIWVVNK